MEIHESIKAKRQQLGLTQKDFADALGLGKNGDRTIRRWEKQFHLAKVLGKQILSL